jgi:hypothetical protein
MPAPPKLDEIAIWIPTLDDISQTAHIFIASTVVLASAHFAKRPWTGFWIAIAWAGVKEFIFDPIIEQDSWESCLWDFAFYCLGAAITILAIVIISACKPRGTR